MRAEQIAGILSISILTLILFTGAVQVATLSATAPDLNTGPYVDNVVFKVISSPQQRVLAIQTDQIETDTSFLDPIYYDTLDADPDIDIYSSLRNGYGQITINCRDSPLNESVLRRAFAFAYDKTRVTAEIMDGWSQEHDSLVPLANSWCVEDLLPYHYYANQASIGNEQLNESGLFPFGGDGYRTYKGAPFNIEIEYPAASSDIAGGISQIGVDALLALHINAQTKAVDFNDYISRLDSHGEYDMVFYAINFYHNDVDWLAYEYWSDYADVPYQNPTNFQNATYDSWRNQLLNGTTYEEIYEASWAMQEILQENVPRLVVYENVYLQAYRVDEFTGYVGALGGYISGPWTMRKVHRIDGSSGGTFSVAIAQEPDSFNFFVTNSQYSAAILENLYSSLYKYGPDLIPVPDLAESMLIETHADNSVVPVGHTRFTVNIVQNATWSDGEPLTAVDVAFTYVYEYESYAYGNPAGTGLGELVAAYAPTPYIAVIEFSSESYWIFSSFAYDYIIPEHIFNDVDGIGFAGWNTWNPVFDPSEPQVTSGPFLLTDYEAGEFYEISKNPLYYYQDTDMTTTSTSPSTTTTTTITAGPPPDVLSAYGTSYVEGTTGNEVYWIVSDDNPLSYFIFINGELNYTSLWDGSNIFVNVDGLAVGVYNVTLMLCDASMNYVFSSIFVTVTPQTTTGITTTTGTTSTTTSTGTASDSSQTSTTSSTVDGSIWSSLVVAVSIGSSLVIIVVIVLFLKNK